MAGKENAKTAEGKEKRKAFIFSCFRGKWFIGSRSLKTFCLYFIHFEVRKKNTMPPKPWKVLSSRINECFRIFNLRTDHALSPRTQHAHDFYILESTDWVNVIPITSLGEIVLVRQYRHGTRDVTLEIPGGIVEPQDSPEDAARRELIEETGFKEREMVFLGSVNPNPAFLTNRCYTYVARNVVRVKTQEQDEKEDIEVEVMPLEEIPRLIREGEITHALVLAAFYRFYMEYLPGLSGDAAP